MRDVTVSVLSSSTMGDAKMTFTGLLLLGFLGIGRWYHTKLNIRKSIVIVNLAVSEVSNMMQSRESTLCFARPNQGCIVESFQYLE